jgi:hypothetical protein
VRVALSLARGHGSVSQSAEHFSPRSAGSRATFSGGQRMSTEEKPEKPGEESAEWHRARANSLRKNGFTKMAEEHEQITQMIERWREQQQEK